MKIYKIKEATTPSVTIRNATVEDTVERFTSKLFLSLVALLMFAILMFAISSETLFSQLRPIFPVGERSVSISCQLRFLSDYPADDIISSMQTSPIAYNSKEERVMPYFYLVPTANLPEVITDDFSIIHQHSVSSMLFFDYETNVIIIAPTQPFSYNTSYSVVFRDFPLLKPNINKVDGYEKVYASAVFEDYIQTISSPLSITDISFQKTGNVVWNLNEDIVLNFSKPIAPKLEILDSMFTVIKIGEATTSEGGTLNYEFIKIPTSAELNEDRKSVTLRHIAPFESGASYFLNVNWEYYLGHDFSNTSYSFSVPDRIIADIKVHFPNGILVNEFNYKGYGGQKLYHYGDTIRLGFPAVYEQYYLSDWKLPETTIGTLYQHGEILELILDSENFFSNAQGNPAFNGIKRTGITIDVYYTQNPIDTLRISSIIDNDLATQHPDYIEGIVLEGGIESKINDTTYTLRRYSATPVYISYSSNPNNALTASFRNDSLATFVNSLVVPANLIFPQTRIPTNLLPPSPPIQARTPVITTRFELDVHAGDMLTHDCETGLFSVVLIFEGDDRGIEENAISIKNAIRQVALYDWQNTVYYPHFPDSNAGIRTNPSQPQGVRMSDGRRFRVSEPVRARYEVELRHPDYEIFLVTTKYGPGYCTVDGNVTRANSENNTKWHWYSKLQGASSISGEIRTENYNACDNILRVYIRRKIVEFAFDVDDLHPVGTNKDRVPNLTDMRLEFEDKTPVEMQKEWYGSRWTNWELKSTLPRTNYPDSYYDEYGKWITNYDWTEFIGEDKSVAGSMYHRRQAKTQSEIDNKGREFVWRERVSVFFYSGESFSYRPYIKEGAAYKLERMTLPENSDYEYDPDNPERWVRVMNFKNSDKITLQSEVGFILEYIQVPKPNHQGYAPTDKYQRYAVCNYGVTEYDIPLWNSELLSDFDNGLHLNVGGSGRHYHNHTVEIKLKFNKDYFIESVSNNILIEELPNDGYNYLYMRPDGEYLSTYPIKFRLFGQTHSSNWNTNFGSQTGEMYVTLMNKNVTTNSGAKSLSMCNLQKFNIDIRNTRSNPILGGDDIHFTEDYENLDTLSNIRGFARFTASTIPPGLAIQNMYFSNIDYYAKSLWGLILMRPDIYIGNMVLNVTDGSPMPNPDDIRTYDSIGRITYNTNLNRFPNSGRREDLGTGDVWWNSTAVYLNKQLRADQNILNLYHWTDDWDRCRNNINGLGDLLIGAGRILAAIQTGGTDIRIGQDSVYIDQDGNKDTVKKAIRISEDIVEKIVNGFTDGLKKWICGDDEEMGYTNFWLANSGLTTGFNNQYRVFDSAAQVYCKHAINSAEANEWFEKNIKQDWNLWGVGTYGMYNPSVRRDAYNIKFDVNDARMCVCHSPIVDNGVILYPFRPIVSSYPSFYTRIELWTGDNR